MPQADSGGREERMMAGFKRSYLTFIVLTLLAEKEQYGYELSQTIKQRTKGQYGTTFGALYPILNKLEKEGAISSRKQQSPGGPERKYYCLTIKGESLLQQERRAVEALVVFLPDNKP